MNTLQQLEAIRAACIAANPERPYPDGYLCDGCGECEACSHYDKYERHIRLADVLFAIETNIPKNSLDFDHFEKAIVIFTMGGSYKKRWNLRADNLSLQPPETISFLYELLQSPTPSENKPNQ